jgi:hypothetical protein
MTHVATSPPPPLAAADMNETQEEDGAVRSHTVPGLGYNRGKDDKKNSGWIRLTEGKQFSRLLYPNPVCFLCTMMTPSLVQQQQQQQQQSSSSPIVVPFHSNNDINAKSTSTRTPPPPTTTTTATGSTTTVNHVSSLTRSPNVMVVTWLTATNNHGQFIMSLNRHRHTATFFESSSACGPSNRSSRGSVTGSSSTTTTTTTSNSTCHDDNHDENARTKKPKAVETDALYFTLCVPVQGMEELIRTVGGTSGKWGNKFPSSSSSSSALAFSTTSSSTTGGEEHQREEETVEDEKSAMSDANNATKTTTTTTTFPAQSRRQQKRKRRHQQATIGGGIPGLRAVPLGGTSRAPSNGNTTTQSEYPIPQNYFNQSDGCFAIEGTIAHLKCRRMTLLSPASSSSPTATVSSSVLPMLDDDHYLIVAQIVDAYCHESYWDTTKNLFRPMGPNVPPYLTFLGSQTFGQVVVLMPTTDPPL